MPTTWYVLSVSFHHCSMVIFILPRKTCEAWEPYKQQCSFGNQGPLDRNVLSLFVLRRVNTPQVSLERLAAFTVFNKLSFSCEPNRHYSITPGNRIYPHPQNISKINFNIITSYNTLSHILSPVSRFHMCNFLQTSHLPATPKSVQWSLASRFKTKLIFHTPVSYMCLFYHAYHKSLV